MALSVLERDTLARACAVAKQTLLDLQPKVTGLREIYDSAGGVKTTLTQADLDAEEALSGITKAEVDDAMFVLTGGVLPAIEAGLSSLSKLAARTL